jgi:hypothetical protein
MKFCCSLAFQKMYVYSNPLHNPKQIWFHVDNMSSAHVYLRRPIDEKIEDVNPEAIAEMCQLVKNNSIDGCKATKVDVIYTEFANLKKTQSLDVGTVTFFDQKLVYKVKNVEKDKDIVKRIEKTKVEKYPDLEQMKADRDLEEKNRRKKEAMDRAAKERSERKAREEEEERLSYRRFVNNKELSTSNKSQGDGSIESCRQIEDDFW